MKERKNIQYCSKNYPYPVKAFTTFFYVLNDSSMLYYPTTRIYTSINDIAGEGDFVENTFPDRENMALSDTAIALPLDLERLYPLKKDFWAKPTLHYDHLHRLKLFMKMLEQSDFYRLVVTPIKNSGEISYVGALPIMSNTPDSVIEQFMMTSDFPVEETAKFAAIYKVGKPMTINWRTNEAISLYKEKEDKPGN